MKNFCNFLSRVALPNFSILTTKCVGGGKKLSLLLQICLAQHLIFHHPIFTVFNQIKYIPLLGDQDRTIFLLIQRSNQKLMSSKVLQKHALLLFKPMPAIVSVQTEYQSQARLTTHSFLQMASDYTKSNPFVRIGV